VTIGRVSDDSSAILQHTAKLGLSLRARVTIREVRPFDGSVVVGSGDGDKFLSREVARSIYGELA
jgi:hypothetical protein